VASPQARQDQLPAVLPAVVEGEDDVPDQDVEVLDDPDDDVSELADDESFAPVPSPDEDEDVVDDASFDRLSVR
jgi:hypothetical protein